MIDADDEPELEQLVMELMVREFLKDLPHSCVCMYNGLHLEIPCLRFMFLALVTTSLRNASRTGVAQANFLANRVANLFLSGLLVFRPSLFLSSHLFLVLNTVLGPESYKTEVLQIICPLCATT